MLLVYSLFLTWGGLTLLPFGVSTLCWLCMDVTTKERLGAKPRIGTRPRWNTRLKQIKKSGLGDETEGGGDGASPRQVWVEGEGGNDTDDTEDESTLMGMGSAAFIPGYPPPHPDLIWCVSPQ